MFLEDIKIIGNDYPKRLRISLYLLLVVRDLLVRLL